MPLAPACLLLASCGGGGGSPGVNPNKTAAPPVVTAGSISILLSSTELKSASNADSSVTVTAVVKSGTNNALPGVPVTFTADSGALTVTDPLTDSSGLAKATLGTSGDKANRKITVSAQAGGQTATASVNVVGTTLGVSGPSSITTGSVGDFTIVVKDSSGAPLANVPLTFSSQKGNAITVKTSGGGTSTFPLTNSQGQIVLAVTGTVVGADVLSLSGQGVNAIASFDVSGTKLTATVFNPSNASITQAATSTSCSRIAIRYENNGVLQNGNVSVASSRGRIYSDSACSALLSTSVPVTNGNSQPTYIKSDTAGFATITALIVNGPSVQTTLEYIAALTSASTISVQADPAVISANTNGSQTEQSTIRAVVRDGTAQNNLVKNAQVEFSILTDQSGGGLSNPSVVTTGSDGSASVSFISGTADTPKDGVEIQARLPAINVGASTKLTVSRKSLFISAGTGNLVEVPSSTQYKKDYTVFVTDASGNAVPNVTVTASAIPTSYAKGTYTYSQTAKRWVQNVVAACSNEDRNKNGILDTGDVDQNGNGTLEPGIPLTVTSSGKTDALGTATISVVYTRDRATWTEVELGIRGNVSGTESTYRTTFVLPAVASDYSDEGTNPPGNPSPYGVNTCDVPN